MKKFLAVIITAALLTSALTACSGESGDNGGASSAPAGTEDGAESASENTEPSDSSSESGASESDIDAAGILDALKEAYGEDYLPSMPVEREYLVSVMGLEEDSFTDFAGELPMISAHADMAVIVKAAEGRASDVREKLEAYRTMLIEDSFQYPMNLPKINASKVLENGDYLGFIILGAFGDDEETDDAKQAEFAEEQIKIGVDAFNDCFA
ncbi:MAG: DUF4358 domain-containing protein [Bacteroides sp.]|nr:DUF4358 domain-containing protein [Bacteroides sp.]